MDEQVMQFADPDWKPPSQRHTQPGDVAASIPQPVNKGTYDTSHRSQPAGTSFYEQGYRGPLLQEQPHYAPPNAQQMPQRQAASTRRRSRWWVWVIILVVIFSIINGANRSSYGPAPFPKPYNGGSYADQQTRDFGLAGVSQVRITDWADSIQLQQGDSSSDQVEVQGDVADMGKPQAAIDGNTLTITVNPTQGGNTIVVTLPAGVNVSLETTSGDIEVDGYAGQVSAKTDSGAITLNGDTLSGPSAISSNSGDINLFYGSVSGTTSLSTVSGSVTLQQEALSGQFSTNVGATGTISFAGTLDPQGTYQFTTYEGNIDLALPTDTSMQVHESTGPGGSYSSAFPQSTGKTPRAALNLKTTSGGISINKASSS